MTSNEDLVRIVGLQFKLDQNAATKEEERDFEQALNGIKEDADRICLMLASKLLAGKPYKVQSDNPHRLPVLKSLAEYIGASTELIEDGPDGFVAIFNPSPSNRLS